VHIANKENTKGDRAQNKKTEVITIVSHSNTGR